MYCDAHTHLNNDILYPHRQTHLDDFTHSGGTVLINVGVNQSYNTRGIEIAKKTA